MEFDFPMQIHEVEMHGLFVHVSLVLLHYQCILLITVYKLYNCSGAACAAAAVWHCCIVGAGLISAKAPAILVSLVRQAVQVSLKNGTYVPSTSVFCLFGVICKIRED